MAEPKKKKGDDGGDTTVETPETSEAGATATDPRVAELEEKLAAALDAQNAAEAKLVGVQRQSRQLEGQVESLRDELSAARDLHQQDMAAMKRRFDQAWAERIGGQQPESVQAGPVRGKPRRFAASMILCHDDTGAKLALRAGDEIPDNADLTGVGNEHIEVR